MRKVTALWTMAMFCFGVMGVQAAWAEGDQSPVSFRLASTTPVRGFEKMTAGGETVYVASKAALSGVEVTFAEAVDGTGLELALTDGTAGRLKGVMQKRGADRLAIFVGGRLLTTATPTIHADGDRAVLSGLASEHANRVARVLNGEALAGPTIVLVPSRSTMRSGESLTVDLFLRGGTGVRTYQTGLAITGGTRGELAVADLAVVTDHPNFVFGTLPKIEAADKVSNRLGATLISGGVEVTNGYLGTFTLAASADAAGSFDVNLQMDRTSFLRNSGNEAIEFFQGPTATITVSAARRLQESGK